MEYKDTIEKVDGNEKGTVRSRFLMYNFTFEKIARFSTEKANKPKIFQ